MPSTGRCARRAGGYAILDWGDSFIGHPLLDERAFAERLPPSGRRAARGWFVSDWERIYHVSDAPRMLRQAVADDRGAVVG